MQEMSASHQSKVLQGRTCFWAALSKMRASHLPLRSCQRTPLYMEEPLRAVCPKLRTEVYVPQEQGLAYKGTLPLSSRLAKCH